MKKARRIPRKIGHDEEEVKAEVENATLPPGMPTTLYTVIKPI